jgi:hypothetical protein
MVGRKDALVAEMKELKEDIDLYIKANPNYKRKGEEEVKEAASAVVLNKTANVEEAFTLI